MKNSDLRCLVTGGAGFIGSHLVDRLLQNGNAVQVFDNLSTGMLANLRDAQQHDRFRFIQGDLLDEAAIRRAAEGVDVIFHLAANADVRFGTEHPRRDLEQNTIVTYNVLEAARLNGVGKFVFSSTGSVYGEAPVIPTPEDAPFPVQTSLYGASKVAGECLIQAYAEGFGMRGYIFRFVSILGERYSHGHVIDFYRKLMADPTRLPVLGNGHQKKSYLYVHDCIDAIFTALDKAEDKVNIFNLGTDEYCEVNDSIGWICGHMGISPKLEYAGGDRGWIGDNPFILLDCARMRSLGWAPRLTIRESIIKTLRYLQEQA
ncbi:MAG TPA: NAD-dependent epimerase/dehydratase family protein [Kiritimatiellia bacterium]|nr:NAD-dependent epimerase/dehydratase family protein [Kiritimatiellia bacterium]HMO98288.1 NAD-dependent epimerase/dehydratase family protein [Kiritimatiellia bacterium]